MQELIHAGMYMFRFGTYKIFVYMMSKKWENSAFNDQCIQKWSKAKKNYLKKFFLISLLDFEAINGTLPRLRLPIYWNAMQQ